MRSVSAATMSASDGASSFLMRAIAAVALTRPNHTRT
jgi:hypothetical protein